MCREINLNDSFKTNVTRFETKFEFKFWAWRIFRMLQELFTDIHPLPPPPTQTFRNADRRFLTWSFMLQQWDRRGWGGGRGSREYRVLYGRRLPVICVSCKHIPGVCISAKDGMRFGRLLLSQIKSHEPPPGYQTNISWAVCGALVQKWQTRRPSTISCRMTYLRV